MRELTLGQFFIDTPKYHSPRINLVVEPTSKAAGALAPPPLTFLGGFILGTVINFLFPLPISGSIWIQLFGAVPLVLGIWLLASANITFRRHKTPPEPWKPSVELVQDGPYRFTRNPIYASFAAIYLGASFFFNSSFALTMLIPVLVLFDRNQIPREEHYLEEKFGEEYIRYKAKVRRWI